MDSLGPDALLRITITDSNPVCDASDDAINFGYKSCFRLILPPAEARADLEFVEIVLPVLDISNIRDGEGLQAGVNEPMYKMEQIEWLYPVRQLHDLGFHPLKMLKLTLDVRGWKSSEAEKEEMLARVLEQVCVQEPDVEYGWWIKVLTTEEVSSCPRQGREDTY